MPKKNWHQNNEDTGKGKFSDARKRIATFRTEPRYATNYKVTRLLDQRLFYRHRMLFHVFEILQSNTKNNDSWNGTRWLKVDFSTTAVLEDIPAFWQLRKMTPDERKKMENCDDMTTWTKNMIERGYEKVNRTPEDGKAWILNVHEKVFQAHRSDIEHGINSVKLENEESESSTSIIW